MIGIKLRTGAALLLAAGVSYALAAGKPAVADADLEEYVAGRIKAWQPTAAERRFDEIAWTRDIREALRLAKQHNRPVFLFTHKGRMNIGRC
jgi:hypothetical protein